jgi:hypothetical protein
LIPPLVVPARASQTASEASMTIGWLQLRNTGSGAVFVLL